LLRLDDEVVKVVEALKPHGLAREPRYLALLPASSRA
jgi:hypothetical protein